MDFRRIYNRLSRTYDRRHASPTTQEIRKREVPLIRRFASGRTLDLGCGTGFHLPLVKGSIGLDVSEGMLSLACCERPLVQGRCERLPFRDRAFDTVMCMFSVLNVCDPKRTVREMARVLKPSGRVIASVASIWDRDYDTLRDKKKAVLTREMKSKRFQVSGDDVEIRLFTRDELEGLFRERDMIPEHFGSVFILQKPYWGDLSRFTLQERARLRMERFYPRDYGCIYFMVFRKA